MLDLIVEALRGLGCLLLGIFLLVWWVGGPAMAAIMWSEGDQTLALQFLALWVAVTALYLTLSRLVRRARRA